MRRLAQIVVTVIAVALFTGLAIWGSGGWSAFFSVPARLAVTLVNVGLTVVGFFSSGNLSAGQREDRSNRWVLIPFGIIGLASAFLPAYTERVGLWTLDGDALRWTGVAVYAIGGVLRMYPVFVLGDRFSGLVAIQEGHTLVTTGIYATIRNPSYLGLILMLLGWGLVFRSGVGILLAVLILISLIPRMDSEEKLLLSQFGDEYEAYRKRTWRLIPCVY